MSGFSRLATATLILTGLGSVAHAQTSHRVEDATFNRYNALVDDRRVVVEAPADNSGVVPPSESHTVMGLRVPR